MNSSKVLIILVLFAVAVRGFNLNFIPGGSEFVNLLNTESNNIVKFRSTRDTDNGVDTNAQLCCNEMKPSVEELEQNKTECRNNISLSFGIRATESYLTSHMDSNETACYAECLLRRSQLLDSDGQIIMKEAIRLLKLFGINNQTTLDKISTRCVISHEGNSDAPGEIHVCNTTSKHFLLCAQRTRNMNCPMENRVQTDSCRRFWEKMKENNQ
ncbi:uncharacterized protein LOC110838450 [Zootermopsis nevadensis]|uniref:uncharacterized protein LOC110838450 n=1 Tax=Zootermopsis nevadensis TaxID=136037 RepID=UPI000B8E9412|nr:uncharacterized protein LOC110838450 [Zootermopsis nevadensis]